jgi:hypothetical protein
VTIQEAFADFRREMGVRLAFALVLGPLLGLGLATLGGVPTGTAFMYGAAFIGFAPSLMGLLYLAPGFGIDVYRPRLAQWAVALAWTVAFAPLSLVLSIAILVVAGAIVGIDPFRPIPSNA